MVNMSLSGGAQPSKWLLIPLLITVILTAWVAIQGDDAEGGDTNELASQRAPSNIPQLNIKKGVVSSSHIVAATPQNALFGWHKLKREPLQNKTYNLFKVHSWLVVPPVKKIKAQPAPAPVAPPAPFTYVGRLEQTAKNTQIFMLANGRLYSTRSGEKIDQQWRLDAEDANALRLTYLPLNLPQVLSKFAKLADSASAPIAETNL